MAKLIQDLSIGGNLRKLREALGLTPEEAEETILKGFLA